MPSLNSRLDVLESVSSSGKEAAHMSDRELIAIAFGSPDYLPSDEELRAIAQPSHSKLELEAKHANKS